MFNEKSCGNCIKSWSKCFMWICAVLIWVAGIVVMHTVTAMQINSVTITKIGCIGLILIGVIVATYVNRFFWGMCFGFGIIVHSQSENTRECDPKEENQNPEFDEFPRWSGDWYIEGNADGSKSIINVINDETTAEYFELADICLELDDVLSGNIKKGIIEIDCSVFDDFVKDDIISICFSDSENPDEIFYYKMISESDEAIKMKNCDS